MITGVFSWALLAVVIVELIVGKFFLYFVTLIIIAIAGIAFAHWPRKDYSEESTGALTLDGYESTEPSIFTRFINWFKTN